MFGQYKFNAFLKHPGYNGGKGGGTNSTQTVQKSDPWSGVQPYLTEAYGRASNLYASGQGPQLYPNQMYVSPDPLSLQARSDLLNYGQNQLPSDINTIRSSYGTLLGAADVNNNPYLASAAQGAIRPITQQLTENILPSIRSGAVQTGQYGGSRQGLAEGTAIGKAVQSMGDITSNMYSNAYNQGLDTLSKAMLFGPQVMQLSQMPSQIEAQVGAANEADAAKALQEQMTRFNYGQTQPYTMLGNYMSLLQGASPYASTMGTSTGPGMQTDPFMGAIGLGTLGLGLYNAGLFGAGAAGAGAAGGALAGLGPGALALAAL